MKYTRGDAEGLPILKALGVDCSNLNYASIEFKPGNIPTVTIVREIWPPKSEDEVDYVTEQYELRLKEDQ